MNNTNTVENGTTKMCNKCGRVLPIKKFRLVRGQFHNPYYLGQCKECAYLTPCSLTIKVTKILA